jgi:general L-amino acid transport system substrate-binding protein
MHKFILSAIAGFFALAVTPAAVKARGQLVCGVSAGLVGFMHADSQGVWRGLSVDMCRATAAALLGDASKVKYVPLEPLKRFPALEAGEVDLLSSNSTVTLSRDTSVDFVGIYYYDGRASWCRAILAGAS